MFYMFNNYNQLLFYINYTGLLTEELLNGLCVTFNVYCINSILFITFQISRGRQTRKPMFLPFSSDDLSQCEHLASIISLSWIEYLKI